MRRSICLAALLAAATLAPCAGAQEAAGRAAGAGALRVQAPPTGYAGTLVKYAEDGVTLADGAGRELVVAMTPGWTVSRPRPMPSTAIRPGDFVASANKVVDGTTGRATELRIMEPGYRPEYGTHMMAQADTAMTHGTVGAVTRTAQGVELDVTYPDGARHLILPGEMTIMDYQPLGRDVLRPGVKVNAVARRGADGILRAGRLTLDP